MDDSYEPRVHNTTHRKAHAESFERLNTRHDRHRYLDIETEAYLNYKCRGEGPITNLNEKDLYEHMLVDGLNAVAYINMRRQKCAIFL